MAANATITRRAALLGALTSTAVLALPAVAAATKPENLRDLPGDGLMLFNLMAGQTYRIDTAQTPHVRMGKESCGVTNRDGTERMLDVAYIEPEAGARYLILFYDGRLMVSELEGGDIASPLLSQKQRVGFMREADEGSMRARYVVQVLGKVL